MAFEKADATMAAWSRAGLATGAGPAAAPTARDRAAGNGLPAATITDSSANGERGGRPAEFLSFDHECLSERLDSPEAGRSRDSRRCLSTAGRPVPDGSPPGRELARVNAAETSPCELERPPRASRLRTERLGSVSGSVSGRKRQRQAESVSQQERLAPRCGASTACATSTGPRRRGRTTRERLRAASENQQQQIPLATRSA